MWGWTERWCYVDKNYDGPFKEFVKPSDTYPSRFYAPCKPSAVLTPEIILSRVNTSQHIDVSQQSGSWFANQTIKTGTWQIEYRSGSAVCSTEYLKPVKCADAYNDMGGNCIPVPDAVKNSSNPVQLIAGITVGVFAVLALAGVLYYFTKNPEVCFDSPLAWIVLFLIFMAEVPESARLFRSQRNQHRSQSASRDLGCAWWIDH